MDNPYLTYKEKVCINCINKQCNKQLVIREKNDTKTIKCLNYIKRDDIEPYKEPLRREARQLRSLMGFHQEY